ncbi:MAG: metallophosphoesterase [Planctomycetota bacterium]|nr:metallophosphoesterase [Planctomycetota bacterium]
MHLASMMLVTGIVSMAAAAQTSPQSDDFLIKPYLQMGPNAPHSGSVSLQVQWASRVHGSDWTLETRLPGGEWSKASAAADRRIDVGTVGEHWFYNAQTGSLAAGELFEYRVAQAGRVRFEAQARVLNKDPAKLHAVVFGDCAAATDPQRRIAHLAGTLDPDLVVIPGDVVYSRGRLSEYLDRFFPVYNSDRRSEQTGAPLLRSTLFVAAAGNHDLSNINVDKYPDAMAFYWLWSMPRNGPALGVGNVLSLSGEAGAAAALRNAAADAFPNATNYSFNAGKVHWTILDSNTYVHWDDPSLVAWVAADLKAAADASWRFVVFHHPPFHASDAHKEDQWMRVLCPVLEEGGVDLVIGGHVHNYQRSKPLRFRPEGAVRVPRDADGLVTGGPVAGSFSFDEAFDGKTITKAHGIIYLVSGAGGADLYSEETAGDRAQWPPFTAAYASTQHSLTVLDVDGASMTIRQLDVSGNELDRVTVTK